MGDVDATEISKKSGYFGKQRLPVAGNLFAYRKEQLQKLKCCENISFCSY